MLFTSNVPAGCRMYRADTGTVPLQCSSGLRHTAPPTCAAWTCQCRSASRWATQTTATAAASPARTRSTAASETAPACLHNVRGSHSHNARTHKHYRQAVQAQRPSIRAVIVTMTVKHTRVAHVRLELDRARRKVEHLQSRQHLDGADIPSQYTATST